MKQSKYAVVLILAQITIKSKGTSKSYVHKLSIFVVRETLCEYCNWLLGLKSRQREAVHPGEKL